jgi:excisionase family DNA binding protein
MRSLSTGEAARITKTSVQTVIRWINEGMLKAWKVPGSRFRRIEEKDLRHFMVKHNIPLHFLDTEIERVLFISERGPLCSLVAPLTPHGFPVLCAPPFEAGMRMADSPIALVVIDEALGETKVAQILNTLASRACETPATTLAVDARNTESDSVHQIARDEVVAYFTQRTEEILRRCS